MPSTEALGKVLQLRDENYYMVKSTENWKERNPKPCQLSISNLQSLISSLTEDSRFNAVFLLQAIQVYLFVLLPATLICLRQ